MNLGDNTFPVDSYEYDNCGAQNRVRFHLMEDAAKLANMLSYCPAGGDHGVRSFADWNQWVLDAVKAMLHTQQVAPTFAGYQPPELEVGPNGIDGAGKCVP